MRNIIKLINKKSLADATGISYSRLRKFSAGQLKSLTSEEINKISKYFLALAEYFRKGDSNDD